MKKLLLTFIFTFPFICLFAQTSQWAWMGGESNYTSSSYGIKGVADPANRPGDRNSPAHWKDAAGNFWLFGGSGVYNDLWTYDPLVKVWTWVGGDSISGQKAVYGSKGVVSPVVKPGASSNPVGWTDAAGNFWLYTTVLWKYDPAINQWMWVSGDSTAAARPVYGTKGVADAANYPALLPNPVEWTDASGDFWLYGNVLWKYSKATNRWTWISGDTAASAVVVYGVKGVPDSINTPGSRTGSGGWTDASGKFWMFGGSGHTRSPFRFGMRLIYDGDLNDLWRYDPASNLWTWISGDSIPFSSGGTSPSARSGTVNWTDSTGNLWLYGGYTYTASYTLPWYHPLGDVWKYDVTSNLWTFFYNAGRRTRDTFEVIGAESPVTQPAARYGATGWTDASGNVWVFGGSAFDEINNFALSLNDLIQYNPRTKLWALQLENNDGRQYGHYGAKGVAGPLNIPGGRQYPAGWTDTTGNLWLFGGMGYSVASPFPAYLNDLWKRDSTNRWTWISGLTSSLPPARTKAVTWRDFNNKLWLYGGENFGITGFSAYLSDLWSFDISSGQWTAARTFSNARSRYGVKGIPSDANTPGGRQGAVSWTDNTGKLWMFGGYLRDLFNEYGEKNDVWTYDPVTKQWTWIGGDSTYLQASVYGTKGTAGAGNKPGARQGAVSWNDGTGNVWVFGGYLEGSKSCLNDLWKYNVSGNTWTWISGDSGINKSSVYGVKEKADSGNRPGGRYDAVSWMDATGRLWLFGGQVPGASNSLNNLNDLWSFDTAAAVWMWAGGDSMLNQQGRYGRRGTPDAANKPGARSGAVGWGGKSGDFYMMGGIGWGQKGSGGLNDVWKWSLAAALPLPVKLLDFSARAANKEAVLQWHAAEEHQGAYYAIQRSADGHRYDSIGRVTSIQAPAAVHAYSFTDSHPFTGINYYRLKQVDLDGRFVYSFVSEVLFKQAVLNFVVINPAQDRLKVQLQTERPGKLQLNIRDLSGHLLTSREQPVNQGNTAYSLPVKHLPAGTYFITLRLDRTVVTRKFVKLP